MKKISLRWPSLMLVINLMFGNMVPVVFAQELATSSASEASSSGVVESSPSAQPVFDVELPAADLTATGSAEIPPASNSGSVTDTFIDDATDQLLLTVTPTVAPSAVLKQKPSLRNFSRRDFRSDERISVTIDNGYASETDIAVFDSNGNAVDVGRAIISVSDPLVYKLSLPREFRPGRFRIKVTTMDGQVSTQDFTWGVLAINPNKSIYRTGETARLSMAVLNEAGLMVCNALLTLEITDPDGQTSVLTTQDGTIAVNPECLVKAYVEKPDYESSYVVHSAGGYTMKLHATTQNGEYGIIDGFEVRESVSFDVERKSNTRLFPPVTYPMEISITAAEDFSGTIEEIVPGYIAIGKLDGVAAFDAVTMETISTSSALKEANIPILGMPTDRLHPISLTFGDQLRDPLVRQKYADFGLLGHDGIDFDMPEGMAVLAVDDGIVVKADINGDYGETVVLQHSWGRSYYGHLSTITVEVGEKKQRGYPIGVSGSTGLSTGPHLHFGIKSNVNDKDNGYYGKINPFAYLSFKDSSDTFGRDIAGVSTPSAEMVYAHDVSVQKITWRVNLIKGQTAKIGYTYQVPNISPQFYLLGPLTMRDSDGTEVFQSTRPWQLAVDADGSGTNTVSPTTGTVSATDQTYTFTFTAAETMDSGGFTIVVPSGWPNAPQTSSNSTAGYTTAVGTGNATVGRVITAADSATGWSEQGGTDACATLGTDATTKQEGSASITCNNSATNGCDGGDGIAYSFSTENWSTLGYNQVGFWARSDDGMTTLEIDFVLDETTDCTATQIMNSNFSSALTADTWVYQKIALSGTLTDVESVCFLQVSNSADNDQYWIDDVLVGPAVPIITGSGPWTISTRILDAANTETFTVKYGDTVGSAAGDVTNSASSGVHTFTTQSRISDAGTLTNIGTSPTVTLSASGPTVDQQMRHGNWFSGGVEQSFTF